MINFYSDFHLEAGCDEAGRGCLAGPVFAAAVILPRDFFHKKLNDSKKLSKKNRLLLRQYIMNHALDYHVASVDEREIDRLNILNASIKAMHIAIGNLKTSPQFLLIDGNKFYPYGNIPHKCIVKGDSLYASIAAASILAKTFRDDYMDKLSIQLPEYGWSKNKGYGTLFHRKALLDLGPSEFHRKSFKLKEQANLFSN